PKPSASLSQRNIVVAPHSPRAQGPATCQGHAPQYGRFQCTEMRTAGQAKSVTQRVRKKDRAYEGTHHPPGKLRSAGYAIVLQSHKICVLSLTRSFGSK